MPRVAAVLLVLSGAVGVSFLSDGSASPRQHPSV